MHETLDLTSGTDAPTTTRRRLLQGVTAGLTVGLAGCQDGSDPADADNPSTSDQADSTPDAFESIDIGTYDLTVSVANPDDLQSMALTRPTSGTIANKQVTDAEVSFRLIGDSRSYTPGEFVLEARDSEDSVSAEHEFMLEPDPHITKVELLKNQDREKLISSTDEDQACAELPSENIYTIENQGTGPAILQKLKVEFPDELDIDDPGISYIGCHEKQGADSNSEQVLAPGESHDFAPTYNEGHGDFRSMDAGETLDAKLGVVEGVSGEWFEQDVTMRFVGVGNGKNLLVYDIPEETME